MQKLFSITYLSLILAASVFFILPDKSFATAGTSGSTVPTTTTPTPTTTATEGGKTQVGVGFPEAIKSGKSYTYDEYIKSLYSFSMKAAVSLCILMTIYAGYKYITSKGDSGGINEAKDIIFSTLTGAALLMLVYLVQNIAGMPTPK